MGKKNRGGNKGGGRRGGSSPKPSPKPSRSPSPKPSPKPSRSPSRSPSRGPSSSPAPARQKAKAVAQMSVKDRRAGAKSAGVSLKDFKQGKTGANAVARKTAQVNRRNPQPSGNNFDKPIMRGGGMYGKDVYNPNSPDHGDHSKPKNYPSGKSKYGKGEKGPNLNKLKDPNAINYDPAARGGAAFGNEDYNHLKSQGHNDKQINNYLGTLDNSQVSNKYKAQGGFTPNPSNTFTTAAGYEMKSGAYNTRSKEMYEKYKAANPTAGTSNMTPDNASFDKDGYLSYDSTKPQWQANDMLKDAGYKQGDMLWKPGALDNLNGRKLTGRIARITELGNYIPEYEHDAVNSSHKSTGNAGYGGEVGLGADQYAYNRQYEQDNDVEYGQVNQQLQANGVSAQGGQQSFDNYGSSQSDFEAPTQAASNFEMPNVQQSMGPQYQGWQEQMGNASQSPYATRSKSSKMNFNFSPYKFQQGQ